MSISIRGVPARKLQDGIYPYSQKKSSKIPERYTVFKKIFKILKKRYTVFKNSPNNRMDKMDRMDSCDAPAISSRGHTLTSLNLTAMWNEDNPTMSSSLYGTFERWSIFAIY